MICNNCGAQNQDGDAFCGNCGSPLPKPEMNAFSQEATQDTTFNQGMGQNNAFNQGMGQENAFNQGMAQNNMNNQGAYGQNGNMQQPPYGFNVNDLPEEYRPISMWGYFGYQWLFAIPCVGFILLLVFAFGGTKNVNLKNFARSYFCTMIIAIVLVVIIFLVFGGIGIAAYNSIY